MNIAEEYAKLYWRCHSKKLWGKNRTPIELITDEHFANIPKFLKKKYPEDIINIEDLPRWLTREIKRREMEIDKYFNVSLKNKEIKEELPREELIKENISLKQDLIKKRKATMINNIVLLARKQRALKARK